MRKIIVNLTISLDGFIEGLAGEYDWCLTDQDYGMTHFLAQVDCLFLGRKSYELLTSTENPFADKHMYVFSRTLTTVPQGVTCISEDWEAEVRFLKDQPGKDIWFFGGANLFAQFLKAQLIDELFLSIHPLLLGGGKPLFPDSSERTHFELVQVQSYDTGLVQVRYQFKK